MPKAKNIKKYIQNTTSKIPRNAKVEGPGVWITCIRGKEKQAIGEIYDLFESLASELYPEDPNEAASSLGDDDDNGLLTEDLEAALAREVQDLKKPRSATRFANCRTDVLCAVFISCRPPIDPVRLVMTHLHKVEETGVTQTRYALRFIPIQDSCHATLPQIIKLGGQIIPPAFHSDPPRAYKYKIQVTSRNHSAVSRDDLIPALAQCVPSDGGHVVDLNNPDLTILVELYLFTCGMSVVFNFDRFKKFNVVSIAHATRTTESSDKAADVHHKVVDISTLH